MTTLQITMLCIWVFLGLGFFYTLGAAFGGAKAGLEVVLGIICMVVFYGGAGALIYFTGKAIFGG